MGCSGLSPCLPYHLSQAPVGMLEAEIRGGIRLLEGE
jgi:hypothetical protein